MTQLNWKEAKLGYLYDIAYHDKECKLEYKLAAQAELVRRAQEQKNQAQSQKEEGCIWIR